MGFRAAMPQRYAQRRVLVAEDDPEMRALMALALRRDGYAVSEVGDGREVLEALGSADLDGSGGALPDLVVSDVRMPGLSGLEVLARMRRGLLDVPVILVSAFTDALTHAEARRLGAWVLDKPFDLGDLRAMVCDALESRR